MINSGQIGCHWESNRKAKKFDRRLFFAPFFRVQLPSRRLHREKKKLNLLFRCRTRSSPERLIEFRKLIPGHGHGCAVSIPTGNCIQSYERYIDIDTHSYTPQEKGFLFLSYSFDGPTIIKYRQPSDSPSSPPL